MFDLAGHVALITGGNSGIGLGFGRGLAKAGASVAIWGRRAEKNAAAADELRALGADVEAFVCDVRDAAAITQQMAATVERFGRVDSCFANAGGGAQSRFLEMSLEDWHAGMDLNLTSVFLTFQAAARHMVERGGGGKLIATSSIGSVHGMPVQVHYSAAKAGVCALCRSLAVGLARHDIQANAVLPGWIETPLTEAGMSHEPLNQAITHRTPARRWGKTGEFEGIAVYLASPESSFQTGDVITIDGGYTVF